MQNIVNLIRDFLESLSPAQLLFWLVVYILTCVFLYWLGWQFSCPRTEQKGEVQGYRDKNNVRVFKRTDRHTRRARGWQRLEDFFSSQLIEIAKYQKKGKKKKGWWET